MLGERSSTPHRHVHNASSTGRACLMHGRSRASIHKCTRRYHGQPRRQKTPAHVEQPNEQYSAPNEADHGYVSEAQRRSEPRVRESLVRQDQGRRYSVCAEEQRGSAEAELQPAKRGGPSAARSHGEREVS